MTRDESTTPHSYLQEQFGCFILHTHSVLRDARPLVEGQLEDLRTGAKADFGSSAELSRLLDEWGGVRRSDERFRAPAPDQAPAAGVTSASANAEEGAS